MAVDCGIDAQAEEVLVVWSQHAGCDGCAVGCGFLVVDGGRHGGEDACGADLVEDGRILAEVPGEDVLVVAYRDDGLQDEDARPCDDGVLRAEVGVFPEDAVVLLVAADYVGHFERLAGWRVVVGVEVFDCSCDVSSRRLTWAIDLTYPDNRSQAAGY